MAALLVHEKACCLWSVYYEKRDKLSEIDKAMIREQFIFFICFNAHPPPPHVSSINSPAPPSWLGGGGIFRKIYTPDFESCLGEEAGYQLELGRRGVDVRDEPERHEENQA